MEIRGGAGGDEAAIFASDLFRMYTKYCELKGWAVSVSSMNEGTAGGFKEIVFTVTGDRVYGTLKYESGVHRCSVYPSLRRRAVCTLRQPQWLCCQRRSRLMWILTRGLSRGHFSVGGAGGQNVNKVESGVRLRYPWKSPISGQTEEILIECTETRDQPKNKERALTRLRSYIYDREHQKYVDDIASRRKTMVSTGDRSAKIRTLQLSAGPHHRPPHQYTIYNLSAFMDGDIQDCIDHLIVAENAEKMKASEI